MAIRVFSVLAAVVAVLAAVYSWIAGSSTRSPSDGGADAGARVTERSTQQSMGASDRPQRAMSEPATMRGADREDARLASPVGHGAGAWWLFTPKASSLCCDCAWTLAESGADEIRADPSTEWADGAVLVRSVEGRRIPIPRRLLASTSEVERLSTRESVNAERLVDVQWDVLAGREGFVPIAAVLIRGSDGLPLGVVGGETTRSCRLPASMEFRLEAEGMAPVSGRLSENASQRVFLRLEPRVCVVGRIAKVGRTAEESLVVNRVDPPVGQAVSGQIATMAEDGSFHVGPLGRGQYAFWLQSESRWLALPSPQVEVTSSRQDVGELAVEVLNDVHFRVIGADSAAVSKVFVSVRHEGRGRGAARSGRELLLDSDGAGRLSKVRPVGIDLEFWTEDGASAEVIGVQGSQFTAATPMLVTLRRPPTLDVAIDVPFALSTAGFVVVVTSLRDESTSSRYLHSTLRSAPERQTVVHRLSGERRVRLSTVMAGSRSVRLLTPEGCVIASAHVDLPADGARSCVLSATPGAGLVSMRSLRTTSRRYVLVRHDGLLAARVTLDGQESREVLLPEGSYRVRDLMSAAGASGASVDLRVEAGIRVHAGL